MTASEQEQRAAVLTEAKRWIGTPFHYEACVHGAGVACGPFMIAVYRAAGIPVPQVVGRFPKDWHLHTTEERYLNIVEQYAARVDEPLPGDAVLFRVFRNRPFCHSAIVIDWPNVIHSGEPRGVEYLDVSQTALYTREHAYLSPWK